MFDLTASQANDSGIFHGGGKYAKKVFFSIIDNIDKDSWTLFGLYDSSKDLDKEILLYSKRAKLNLIDLKGSSILDISKKYLITRFYTALPYSIYFNFLEVLSVNWEVYCTIHGLRSLEYKLSIDALKYATSAKEKIKMSAKIILTNYLAKKEFNYNKTLLNKINVCTVSNHTKYSIQSFFPHQKKDIKVFFSPDVTVFNNKNEELVENLDNTTILKNVTSYYLMVSGNRWLKNNLTSAMALDQLFTERTEMKRKVIITGVSNSNIYKKYLKNKECFQFLKYVSEDELKHLYKNSYAFIYMSLNEGFGYPPLEAMKYSIPVITSPFSSIPEICGDAVLYSNPYSINEIKNRILQLCNDEVLTGLKEKGNKRYKYIKTKQDSDLIDLTNYLLA